MKISTPPVTCPHCGKKVQVKSYEPAVLRIVEEVCPHCGKRFARIIDAENN